MRNTIHVVSRRDYWPLAIAIREERRAWSRRVQGAGRARAAARGRAAPPVPRGRAAVGRSEIAGGRPLASRHRALDDLVRVPPCRDLGAPPRRPVRARRGVGRARAGALRARGAANTSSAATSARSGLLRGRTSPTGPGCAWARSGRHSSAWSSAASVTSRAASCSTCRARRCRRPTRRRRCGSSPPWTRPCWCTHGAPGSSPSEHRKRIFHVQKPAVGPDVPRRRAGRRDLAARGRPRSCWSRSAGCAVSARRELETEGERLAAFHA